MCNLYSVITNQEAIRRLFRVERDVVGNMPPLPAIFPDGMAPVVRNAPDGARELATLCWGLPGPPTHGGAPVTNIRNVASPHWRAVLGQANRCVVPATSFCEWSDTKPRKTPTWFALEEARPVFAFAGVWRTWRGFRGPKSRPEDGEHTLFAFLTCSANAEVAAVHPKAMPVILTEPDAVEAWLTAPAADAMRLQRPLPDGTLRVVARGATEDGARLG